MGKFTKEIQSQEAKPHQQTCQAYGCPLTGTRSNSVKGGGEWWCRYHIGQSADSFALITDRINKSMPMFEHIKRLVRANSHQITTLEPSLYNYLRNPEFSIKETENHGQYVGRLVLTLRKFILDGVEHGQLNHAKSLVDGFQGVTAIKAQTIHETEQKRQQAGALLDAEAKRLREQAKRG